MRIQKNGNKILLKKMLLLVLRGHSMACVVYTHFLSLLFLNFFFSIKNKLDFDCKRENME